MLVQNESNDYIILQSISLNPLHARVYTARQVYGVDQAWGTRDWHTHYGCSSLRDPVDSYPWKTDSS